MGDGPGVDREREWITLTGAPLPLAESLAWVVEPSCGGVVSFLGTVRDHAEGRPGVSRLTYEAYEQGALAALGTLVAEARRRWPDVGRIAVHHRLGALVPTELAVAVVVAAPHRAQAFEAARWCIDTLKATVPIWKHETWEGGSDWSEATTPLRAAGRPAAPGGPGEGVPEGALR